MNDRIVYLERPVNIYELRKTYADGVEFVTDTASYPDAVAVRYSGQLNKVIRGKLVAKSVKERADRLLELYERRLFKFWDERMDALVEKVTSLDIAKGGPGSGCQGPNCGRPTTGIKEHPLVQEAKSYSSAEEFVNAKMKQVKRKDALKEAGRIALGNEPTEIKGNTVWAGNSGMNEEQMIAELEGKNAFVDRVEREAKYNPELRAELKELLASKEKNQLTIHNLKITGNFNNYKEGYKSSLRGAWHASQETEKGGPDKVEKIEKADEQEDEDTKKKRAIIAGILATMGSALAANALDFYKKAYFLGKERGVSISGQDFTRALKENELKRIEGLTDKNKTYLDGFMKDLEDKYVDALQREYQSQEAMDAEIKRITEAHESRLAMYAYAALGALALGFTAGIREGREAEVDALPPGAPEPPEITGMIWVTAHDDSVCPGCADNDGKFFTMDEFEAEYQNNECLVRCRCAETSVPTDRPSWHFGKSARLSMLRKGGPGSGCKGPNCGRPRLDITDIRPALRSDGRVLSGKIGDTHYDVFSRELLPKDRYASAEEEKLFNQVEQGFVDKDNNFITRDELPWRLPQGQGVRETTGLFGRQSAIARQRARLHKGGPGSGCNGPNCGRPKGMSASIASVLKLDNFSKTGKGIAASWLIPGSKGVLNVGLSVHSVTSGKLGFFTDSDMVNAGFVRKGGVLSYQANLNNPDTLRRIEEDIHQNIADLSSKDYAGNDTSIYLDDNVTKTSYKIPSRDYSAYPSLENFLNKKYILKSISTLDIEKGGPGSGCHGPNCGRPTTDIMDVVPALSYQGHTYPGKLGDIHEHIFTRELEELPEFKGKSFYGDNLYNQVQTGFTDGSGKFLTREEAKKKYGVNETYALAYKQGIDVRDYATVKMSKGGPGSGCRGENCGRPKTNFDAERSLETVIANVKANGGYSKSGKGIRYSWLLPKGGVIRADGTTHWAILAEYGSDETKAFDSGWARKGDFNAYQFIGGDKVAQASVERDLRENSGRLEQDDDMVYIDTIHGHDYNSYAIPTGRMKANGYSLDGLLTERNVLKFVKGGPGSGCRGSNCGRPSTGARAKNDIMRVRPALMYQDMLFTGRQGDIHADIFGRQMLDMPGLENVNFYDEIGSRAPRIKDGFVDGSGKFMTRAETKDKYGVDESIALAMKQRDIDPVLRNSNPRFLRVVVKMEKGGPGSGCHGPTCGRPNSLGQREEMDISTSTSRSIRVYKNPTDDDTASLIQSYRIAYPKAPPGEPKIRSTYDAEGNRYSWMAGDAVHSDVERTLGSLFPSTYNQNKVEKGGPGSGCKGPNCGRPKGSGRFAVKSGYPNAFKFNHADPVTTKYSDGKSIDKFVVMQDGTFIPVLADQRHGNAIGDLGAQVDYSQYDSSIRVVQDLSRKLAFIRIAHPDMSVVNAAVIDGDERAMNQVIEYQKGVADELYAKHPGMTVILASGGTPRNDQNNLPSDLDNGYSIPDKPQKYVNAKFMYRP